MAIKLYKLDISPPARACMMACDIFNIKAVMVDVNIMNQEHRTPNYLKLNPLHTVPVLVDGDLILHDSHAILMYLSDTYGKDDTLYPKDTKQRALVNQKLFFNTSILFPKFRGVIYAAFMDGVKKVPENKLREIDEAYGFIEEFLTRTKYLAGDNMTIADLAAITTMSGLGYILTLDDEKYPKTQAWMNIMGEKTFCQKYNQPGSNVAGRWLKSILT